MAISSFTATPSTVRAGEGSLLAWAGSGTGWTIDNGIVIPAGATSVTVFPDQTTAFTLTNDAGDTATVSVIVTPAGVDWGSPLWGETAADDPTVTTTGGSGGGAGGGGTGGGSGGGGTGGGGTGGGGTGSTPVISSFTASSSTVPLGGSVTLSWSGTNLTSIDITPGVGDVTGKTSVTVGVTADTTFVLTAHYGSGQTVTSTVTVTVSGLPPGVHYYRLEARGTSVIQQGTGNAGIAVQDHLRRGVFGAPLPAMGSDHPANKRFAFLGSPGTQTEQGILKMDIRPEWIGKTLKFKFLSFNSLGSGLQSLSDVPAYSYQVTGVASGSNPNGASYTQTPAFALSVSGTQITMSNVIVQFPSGRVPYGSRLFTIPNPATPTYYYVTIADPQYLGDIYGVGLPATAETSQRYVGVPGRTFIGAVLVGPGGTQLNAIPGGWPQPIQSGSLTGGTTGSTSTGGTGTTGGTSTTGSGGTTPTGGTTGGSTAGGTTGGTTASGGSAPAQAAGASYSRLDFFDDFSTFDASTWFPRIWYEPAYGTGQSWNVSNGVLDLNITSARWSQGGNYADTSILTISPDFSTVKAWRYGYFEARMKWDVQAGAWPAFWMNGDRGAGSSFMELDIFEGQGNDTAYFGTVHSWPAGTSSSPNRFPVNVDFSQWHTYGCLWTPGHVKFYLDDVLVGEADTPSTAETGPPLYLILSMQFGNNWSEGNTSGVTATSLNNYVDWVKVWQP